MASTAATADAIPYASDAFTAPLATHIATGSAAGAAAAVTKLRLGQLNSSKADSVSRGSNSSSRRSSRRTPSSKSSSNRKRPGGLAIIDEDSGLAQIAAQSEVSIHSAAVPLRAVLHAAAIPLRAAADLAWGEEEEAKNSVKLASTAVLKAQTNFSMAEEVMRQATKARKSAERNVAAAQFDVKSNNKQALAAKLADQVTVEAEAAQQRLERVVSEAIAKDAELAQALAELQRADDAASMSRAQHSSKQQDLAAADQAVAAAAMRHLEVQKRVADLTAASKALNEEADRAVKRSNGSAGAGKAWAERLSIAHQKAMKQASLGNEALAEAQQEARHVSTLLAVSEAAAREAADADAAAAKISATDGDVATAAKATAFRVEQEAAMAKKEQKKAAEAAKAAMDVREDARKNADREAAIKAADEAALRAAIEELERSKEKEMKAEAHLQDSCAKALAQAKQALAVAEAHHEAKRVFANDRESEACLAEKAVREEDSKLAAEKAARLKAQEEARLLKEKEEAARHQQVRGAVSVGDAINNDDASVPQPHSVHVRTRPTSAKRSVVAGAGLQHCVFGLEAHFTIEAFDTEGEPQPDGGDALFVCVRCCGHGTRIRAKIRDLGNGTYAVSFKPAIPGQMSIGVSLMGEPLPGSPFTCKVDAPTAHPAQCVLSGKALSEITANRQEHFQICYRDVSGHLAHAIELELSIDKVDKVEEGRSWRNSESLPDGQNTGRSRKGRRGKATALRLNVEARQQQLRHWNHRLALDSNRELLKAKDRQDEIEALESRLNSQKSARGSPREHRYAMGLGSPRGSPRAVGPWAQELIADPTGIGLAYGGLHPGRLHAHGRLFDSHKVFFSVGASGDYLLHVHFRHQATPLPGSPFKLTVHPDRAHPLGTYIDPAMLPLRGPSEPIAGSRKFGLGAGQLTGKYGCTLRVTARDKMGNPCVSGGAGITCGVVMQDQNVDLGLESTVEDEVCSEAPPDGRDLPFHDFKHTLCGALHA